MATTAAPSAVESVTAALTANPGGMITRDLADATGLTVTVVSKALSTMETTGDARREADPKGRKSADTWYPAAPADDTAPATNTQADESTDATPADDTSPAADAPATDGPTPVDEATETGVYADPADVVPAPADPVTLPEAPVSGAPVAPAQPHLWVLMMAGVLGGHPEGVTADDAIDESGLSVVKGEAVLAAMEVAGAAHRLPITNDGTELWVAGDNTKLATVDPANAPAVIACPTCGHERKIRRVSALRRTPTGGPARVTAEVNTDGSAKLAKGELVRIVEAFHRDLGPGHELSPSTIGKAINRSPGAIVNAQRKLSARGVLIMTRPAPETYAMADNAPAPADDVRALMAPPATDPATGSNNADDPDDTETCDTAGSDDTDDTAGSDDTTGTDTADAA
ncbi:MarR family transcriptional regulator [Paractinoplanes deccanensis]|nr:MarR family transcriptional regulator [Actinoplanes deccanensis]